MSTVTAVLVKNTAASLPAGSAAFDHTTITLTDSSGTVQTAEVNGTESPAWTAVFDNVAANTGGSGSIVAQDQDATGNSIGAPVKTTYSDVAPAVTTYPATTAIHVTNV